MKIEFSKLPEYVIHADHEGGGILRSTMAGDSLVNISYGILEPGSSIGYHKHENSSEVIYILSGTALCVCDGEQELIPAGRVHFCPNNHSHSMRSFDNEKLIFFSVVSDHTIDPRL